MCKAQIQFIVLRKFFSTLANRIWKKKCHSFHSLKLKQQFHLQKKKALLYELTDCVYSTALTYLLKRLVNHSLPILERHPLIDWLPHPFICDGGGYHWIVKNNSENIQLVVYVCKRPCLFQFNAQSRHFCNFRNLKLNCSLRLLERGPQTFWEQKASVFLCSHLKKNVCGKVSMFFPPQIHLVCRLGYLQTQVPPCLDFVHRYQKRMYV